MDVDTDWKHVGLWLINQVKRVMIPMLTGGQPKVIDFESVTAGLTEKTGPVLYFVT
jgi:hypothetical protein